MICVRPEFKTPGTVIWEYCLNREVSGNGKRHLLMVMIVSPWLRGFNFHNLGALILSSSIRFLRT